MHMVFDIMDMKFLVKFTTNRLNPLVVIKTKKRKKKLYHFSVHIGIKGSQGHYIWYQSESYNAST